MIAYMTTKWGLMITLKGADGDVICETLTPDRYKDIEEAKIMINQIRVKLGEGELNEDGTNEK